MPIVETNGLCLVNPQNKKLFLILAWKSAKFCIVPYNFRELFHGRQHSDHRRVLRMADGLRLFQRQAFWRKTAGMYHQPGLQRPAHYGLFCVGAFCERVIETLSTLAHEMCHVWEYHYGDKKSRRTYHNREWGEKMESIGLMPSNTGLPGGKKTGQQMTHYIIEDGPFETICKELLANNFKISWADRFIPIKFLVPKPGGKPEPGKGAEPEPKIKSKNKYTCVECGASVWGKPDLKIICGHCQREFQRD